MDSIKYNSFDFLVKNIIIDTSDQKILIVENSQDNAKYIFNSLKLDSHKTEEIDILIKNTDIPPLGDTINNKVFFFIHKNNLIICSEYYKGENLVSYINRTNCNEYNILSIIEDYLLEIIEFSTNYPGINMHYFNPENIYITENSNVKCNFFLSNTMGKDKDILYDMESIFSPIISNFSKAFRSQIELICQKSSNNLYSSINEILYDIKNIKPLKREGILQKLKNYFLDHKRLILNLGKILLVLLLIWFVKDKIFFYYKNTNMSHFSNIGEYIVSKEGDVTYTGIRGEYNNIIPDKSSGNNIITLSEISHPIEDISYIIKNGDTLNKITLEHYGSTEFSQKLSRYNGLKNENLIYTGQVILIPDIKELE